MGGRALDTFRKTSRWQTVQQTLSGPGKSCQQELSDTSHFHIDLFGNYIPGLCSGLAINAVDLGQDLDAGKYPIITTLFHSGVNGLYRVATERFGYKPFRQGNINKCDLCTEIRGFLVTEHPGKFVELAPETFYNGLYPPEAGNHD